eukprot:scaffold231790_cov28-Prasinocladus_malaysianus.AAC.1
MEYRCLLVPRALWSAHHLEAKRHIPDRKLLGHRLSSTIDTDYEPPLFAGEENDYDGTPPTP